MLLISSVYNLILKRHNYILTPKINKNVNLKLEFKKVI